jgi:hypothetical protein
LEAAGSAVRRVGGDRGRGWRWRADRGREPGPSTVARIDQSYLLTSPFPLRSGLVCYFHLPRDLSRVDAERLKAFVTAIATPEEAPTDV